MNEPEIQLVL